MKITVFMGERELSEEDFGSYICVSPLVARLVNETYNAYKRRFEKKREGDRSALPSERLES